MSLLTVPTGSTHAVSMIMYCKSTAVKPLTKCVYEPLTLKYVSMCFYVYVLTVKYSVDHSVNVKILSPTRLSTWPRELFHLC